MLVPFFSGRLKDGFGPKFDDNDKFTIEIIEVHIYSSQIWHVAYQNDRLDVLKGFLLLVNFPKVTETFPVKRNAYIHGNGA